LKFQEFREISRIVKFQEFREISITILGSSKFTRFRKFLKFHFNNDLRYFNFFLTILGTSITILGTSITILGSLLSHRVSIYWLETKEFTWDNLYFDKTNKHISPVLIRNDIKFGEWTEDDATFIGDPKSIGEIFDDKNMFEYDFSFYFANEYLYAHFNDSELKTSGVSSLKDTFGNAFLLKKYEAWITRLRDEVTKLIENLRNHEPYGHILIKGFAYF